MFHRMSIWLDDRCSTLFKKDQSAYGRRRAAGGLSLQRDATNALGFWIGGQTPKGDI